jgi:hypothetical protein
MFSSAMGGLVLGCGRGQWFSCCHPLLLSPYEIRKKCAHWLQAPVGPSCPTGPGGTRGENCGPVYDLITRYWGPSCSESHSVLCISASQSIVGVQAPHSSLGLAVTHIYSEAGARVRGWLELSSHQNFLLIYFQLRIPWTIETGFWCCVDVTCECFPCIGSWVASDFHTAQDFPCELGRPESTSCLLDPLRIDGSAPGGSQREGVCAYLCTEHMCVHDTSMHVCAWMCTHTCE